MYIIYIYIYMYIVTKTWAIELDCWSHWCYWCCLVYLVWSWQALHSFKTFCQACLSHLEVTLQGIELFLMVVCMVVMKIGDILSFMNTMFARWNEMIDRLIIHDVVFGWLVLSWQALLPLLLLLELSLSVTVLSAQIQQVSMVVWSNVFDNDHNIHLYICT